MRKPPFESLACLLIKYRVSLSSFAAHEIEGPSRVRCTHRFMYASTSTFVRLRNSRSFKRSDVNFSLSERR